MDDIEQNATSEVEVSSAPTPESAPAAPAEPKSTREIIEAAFDAAEKQTEAPVAEAAAETPAAVADAPATAAAEAPAAQRKAKAPQSWNPAVREKFGTLPADIQDQIAKREGEINTKLAETAQERRVAQEFMQVAGPYSQFFQAQGINPMAATKDALNTLVMLRAGNPAQKASLLANMVKQAGIDFKDFDAALERAFEQRTPTVDPELDQRLRRIEQLAGQTQQQNVAQQQNQVNSVIEQFMRDPKNEFASDVAQEMVALLQAGQAADLPSAYEKAIWTNANTRKVLLDRQNGAAARQAAGNATLSNRGPRSTTNVAPVKGKTTRDILEQLVPQDFKRI